MNDTYVNSINMFGCLLTYNSKIYCEKCATKLLQLHMKAFKLYAYTSMKKKVNSQPFELKNLLTKGAGKKYCVFY